MTTNKQSDTELALTGMQDQLHLARISGVCGTWATFFASQLHTTISGSCRHLSLAGT